MAAYFQWALVVQKEACFCDDVDREDDLFSTCGMSGGATDWRSVSSDGDVDDEEARFRTGGATGRRSYGDGEDVDSEGGSILKGGGVS